MLACSLSSDIGYADMLSRFLIISSSHHLIISSSHHLIIDQPAFGGGAASSTSFLCLQLP
jgi:hypothetical protein